MGDQRKFADFEQVKNLVTIPMALDKLQLLDGFKEKNGVWRGVCPLAQHQHSENPNPKQFVFDNKRDDLWLWHCLGDCNEGGDVIRLVMRIENLSNAHAGKWFAEHFSDVLSTAKPKQDKRPDQTTANPKKGTTKQADGVKPLTFYLESDSEAASDYLFDRGIKPEVAEKFGVGLYNKPGKMFSGYLVMPCYRWPKASDDEYPVGYIGRWPGEDSGDDHPRYKVGFECSNVVYGLGEALDSTDQDIPLLVVEGPLKALWLISRGYHNAVSTFTSNVSDIQAERLIKTRRNIVLAFDGDEAGQKGMRAGAGKLIGSAFVRVIKLPDKQEPDQLDRSELDKFFGWARP